MAAMTCISGPPCVPGKTARSICLASSARPKMRPPRGPRRVLWVVVVTMSACGKGLGCRPAATSPAMWAMSTKRSASTSCAMRGHALEVDDARIGARTGHDEPRSHVARLPLQGLVVDAAVDLRDPVAVDLEVAAAEVDGVAVGQVAAVGEAHAQDAVTVLEHRDVGGDVGLRPGMGLHVDELGTREEGQGAVLGEPLDHVDVLAATVVPLARLALGVLVGEPRPGCLQDRPRRVVLAGDELDLPGLPLALRDHRRPQLGVDDGDGLQRPLAIGDEGHACSAARPLRVRQCTRAGCPGSVMRPRGREARPRAPSSVRPEQGLDRAPLDGALSEHRHPACCVDGHDAGGHAATDRTVVDDDRQRRPQRPPRAPRPCGHRARRSGWPTRPRAVPAPWPGRAARHGRGCAGPACHARR